VATRKQTEASFSKIQNLLVKLRNELLYAERVICDPTPNEKYRDESPLHSFYQLESRIDKKFHDPLANSVKRDLRKKARGY